jgi:nicotinamide riboside kinase
MTRPFIITIFGAESTGKTTLSRQLAKKLYGAWSYEFARPYLETTGEDVTAASMRAIWQGQTGLQRQMRRAKTRYVVQDTDLFSTAGYWQFPHIEPTIGTCPRVLIRDATKLASDLYLIVQSNIPFEPDPIRFDGDVRESKDEYWIELCRHYHLPYVVIDASDQDIRIQEATQIVAERSALCVA